MPLDWKEVQKRYGKGLEVPTVAGGKTMLVTSVDADKIYFKQHFWDVSLSRENLEKVVALIEQGVVSRQPGWFVEDYKNYVVDEHPASAAHILRDLGFLEEDKGYVPRS